MKRVVLAWLSMALFAHVAPATAQPAGPASACMTCHASSQGSVAIGPSLAGVIGRKAGTISGFAYSRAMKSSGLVWDERTLDAFIANPQQVVPGNRMPFSGIADAKERALVIEFLRTSAEPN